jgi:hypothetical protein
VLGHLVQEGNVAKLAGDLYCGGHTPEELLNNGERVPDALQRCNLNLSASKTIVAPKTNNNPRLALATRHNPGEPSSNSYFI